MTERMPWMVTTHDWSATVDAAHLSQVRDNAAVYGAGGRRHLILEVLAYANDEAEALGRVGHVVVTQHDDRTVTVADDGRGTDTRLDSDGHPVRKPVMATNDIRFFDVADRPQLPDGLGRYGMSTVAALSLLLVHENRRGEGSWSQAYRYGIPDEELRAIPPDGTTGTSVTFRADPTLARPGFLTDADTAAFPWLRILLGGTHPLRQAFKSRP